MEFEARKADSGGRVLEQGAVDPLPINKGVRGPPQAPQINDFSVLWGPQTAYSATL